LPAEVLLLFVTDGAAETERSIARSTLCAPRIRVVGPLEARLDGRIDTLQSSMDAMRSGLTQVALAVGVRQRAQND
jgi:hypothetical protein